MSRTRLLTMTFGLCIIFMMSRVTPTVDALTQNESDLALHVSLRPADSRMQPLSEEDISITGNETLTMQNHEYNLTATIVAEDHATILVKNANVTLSPNGNGGIGMVLKGNSRLLVDDSTVNFARLVYGDCQIVLQDEAQANFTETTLSSWGFAVARNSSSVYVEKSRVGDGIHNLHSPGIAAYDTSKVEVENSTVDGVYVWGSSTSSINGSHVGEIRTASSESGVIMINISDSQVGNIETSVGFPLPSGEILIDVTDCTVEGTVYVHDNSTARIERSSIGTVRATGNATVWLIESSVGEASSEDNARVLLGLDLPLLGLVGVPYSLKPIMQAASMMIMLIGIAAISYGVYQKKRAREIQP